MTRDQAAQIRASQLQGGRVSPENLQQALEILSRMPGPQEPLPKAPREKRQKVTKPTASNPWGLTPAEWTVMQMVVAGKSTDEIAEEMDRGYHTIRNHIGRVRNRMGASTVLLAALKFDRFTRGEGA